MICPLWLPPLREARIASERRERGPLGAARAVHHARLVLLQDVRRLVAQDAGQLRLALREQEEPRVHADVPAHEREGVDGVVLHHEVVDVGMRDVRDGEEARAEGGR